MTLTPYPTATVYWQHDGALHETHCVYDVTLTDPLTGVDTVIYIGTCRLNNVFDLPDARRNSEWRNLVKPDSVLGIRVTHTGSRSECANERGRLLIASVPRPICNLRGHDTIGSTTIVTCNETGISYNTQTEAAKANNITQSALSNHLAGKPSHHTVKGLTFRRGR